MTATDTRINYTAGLRALADLIDNHNLPLPHEGQRFDPFTFFIHNNLAEALAVHDAMTNPHTNRDDNKTFPVQIVGTLAGFPALVYVHARIALAPGTGFVIPLPALDPRLAATLTNTEQVAS